MVKGKKSVKKVVSEAVKKGVKAELTSLEAKITKRVLVEMKKKGLGGLYGVGGGKAGLYGGRALGGLYNSRKVR